ncbi:carboxypeptidase-like regulatory domain-containing protein [Flavobacterium anhuiense]|uniref:carboxypeptidase-like regulatory domain-containing protein n=1 Tax=Flavobacterium anhuiense TaxID=459526 RepID=UPI003D95C956
MEKKYAIFFIVWFSNFVFSQKEITVTGIVIDSRTQNPLENVVVAIQNTAVMQLTSKTGKFELSIFPQKEQLLLLRSQGYKDFLLKLQSHSEQNIDLGILQLEDTYSDEVPAALITLSDNDFSEDNSSSEMTSGLLQSSKDAFMQASAFSWGQARFRVRGLDSENAVTMLNGMPMNKIYDGRPQWGNWGGLNNVLRNQEFSVGAAASNYTFGGILGAQQIFTRAALYRKGTALNFSGSNTTYLWRTIGTYASGMNKSGWAFVISGGKRWTDEGYFAGTNFDADSFFLSVEKKLNNKHSINFTGFYTPNSRGKNSANTNEVTNLMGEKYNSYWGFQDSEKRNARVKKVEEPLFMLNHYFKINEKTNLNSAVMFQLGKVGNSNIDYQNADSPDPVYYKKMPSYFSSLYAKDQGEFSGAFTPDYVNAEKSKTAFLANPQIDWEKMYFTNQKLGSNGYEPAQSHYVLYEDRTDDQTFAVNSNLNAQISATVFFDGGFTFKKLKSHNFQYLLDLLGGAYFEDIDPFYKGNLSQSDLQHPNRQVVKGDIYGYNYNLLATTLDVFSQFRFSYNKTEFFLAQSYAISDYQREGLYQNGLYPTSSLGKSEKVNFENFGFKGGFTYKISGKQLLFFNAAHFTKAPSLRNTFSNARLNNNIINGIESENASSAEANYVYRSSKFKFRLTAYYSETKNTSKTSYFYAEGIFDNGSGYDPTNAFVSQTLTKLDKKNTGAELSFEYQISSTLKTTLAAAFGNYVYSSNPNVIITNDANRAKDGAQTTFDFGRAFLKNYKQPGTSQQAYSFGLEYRDPKFWWIGGNINYLAESYIDVSPISRTSQFYINPANGFPFPEATSERGDELLKQEEFKPIMLLNFSGGKSWRIHKKYIGLFASVNNVLDLRYKTGGFEQARNANFRALNQDLSSGTPSFGPRYYYGFGRTYFLNLTIGL